MDVADVRSELHQRDRTLENMQREHENMQRRHEHVQLFNCYQLDSTSKIVLAVCFVLSVNGKYIFCL